MENRQGVRSQRGEIPEGYEFRWQDLSSLELVSLLEQPDAASRTMAARLLGQRRETQAVPALCGRLQKEKALYCRLAASEALVQIGEPALPYLISLLGHIGQNQHTSLPTHGFYKRSYPLPRDLAARVIIRIGIPALPLLESVVLGGDGLQTREAVDAIGHIAFTEKDTRSEAVLVSAFHTTGDDLILRWKLIRASVSFPSPVTQKILIEIILQNGLPPLRWEAVRSLGLMAGHVSPAILDHARKDPEEEVRKMARLFLA